MPIGISFALALGFATAAFDQPNYYGPGLRDQVDWIYALRFEGNMTGTFSGPSAQVALIALSV